MQVFLQAVPSSEAVMFLYFVFKMKMLKQDVLLNCVELLALIRLRIVIDPILT